MPPASFVGSTIANPAAAAFTLAIPSRALVGDQLLAIIATSGSATGTTIPAGWVSTFLGAAADGRKFRVVRKAYAITDPPFITFGIQGAWDAMGHSAMLAYRQIDTAAPIVASASALVTATGTIAHPAISLTRYSDLFVGTSYLNDEGTIPTMPANCSPRVFNGGNGFSLNVFDSYPEAVGSASRTSSPLGYNVSGVCASFALTSLATPPIQTLRGDVSGAIGFTDIGV